MIIRIVHMTFAPERVADFLSLFDATSPHIRRQAGCRRLELWREARYPNILTTYSLWRSEEDLENYRRSELFRDTWGRTRLMFAAPPRATSYTHERSVEEGNYLA